MTIKEYTKLYKKATAAIATIEQTVSFMEEVTTHSRWAGVAELAKKLTKAAKEMDEIRAALGLEDSDHDQEYLLYWLGKGEEAFVRKMVVVEEMRGEDDE